jgi:hypothetical protein
MEPMPSSALSGKVAIVGVDESDRIGAVPDTSMLQLHAEGARNALRDAGLTLKDVDGLFTANISPAEVGEYLGIEPKVVDGTNVGGRGQVIFYPRPLCPSCGSDDLTWTAVSGRGVVHAFAIPHLHPNPTFGSTAAFVVALIELEAGARMMSNLVEVDPTPEAVKVGMAVEIVYDDVTEAVTLPKFRPC